MDKVVHIKIWGYQYALIQVVTKEQYFGSDNGNHLQAMTLLTAMDGRSDQTIAYSGQVIVEVHSALNYVANIFYYY